MKQLQDGTYYGITAGLLASHARYSRPVLVCVEYTAEEEGPVKMTAVSGNTLAKMAKGGTNTISREDYENRPTNPYNNTHEAIWALSLLGWEV